MKPTIYTVRASSWGGLFDCAHRWEGEYLLKMRKASGLRALLGTSVHASTAAFDRARIDGVPCSIDDAAGVFVDTLRKPEFDVDYHQDSLSVSEAEKIGLAIHVKYCTEIAPKFDYVDVETTLDPLQIDCGNGITVRLTGSMDRARVANTVGGISIPDIKTGVRAISNGQANLKGRFAQIGTYQIMYEQTKSIETIGAQIIALSTSGRPQVAVSPIFDAKRVMIGTEDQPGLIQYAGEMFRTGLFPPNPQSQLCSPKYCSRWDSCIFHD